MDALPSSLVVGSMEPWRARFPSSSEPPGGLWGLPVVVNANLKPDQWILVDADGTIILAGNGI
jgi:hypothetical protein